MGEAVTSLLETKGAPGVVERTLIRPPSSQLGPITAQERRAVMQGSALGIKYDEPIDRDSAHERLARRAEQAAREAARAEEEEERLREQEREYRSARRYSGSKVGRSSSRRSRGDSVGTAFAKSMARSLGTRAGSAIVRGVLGSLFKGR